MNRNLVGVFGTVIVAIYVIGSGRMVATDAEWYRSLPRPAWQPPSGVFGIIWPYNFAMLVTATWLVANRLSSGNQMIWLLSLSQRNSRAYLGVVVLWTSLTSCIWFRTRSCDPVYNSTSRHRISSFPGSWLRFFALPTLVSSGYVACLWLRRVGDSWLVEMGTLSA